MFIGFTGYAGAGKSTAAHYLRQLATADGYAVQMLPFAQQIKQYATALGWNGVKDAKGRRLLQLLGTECGRECIDKDIWVDAWRVRTGLADITIADDVRFDNEVDAITDCGVIINVSRPETTCGLFRDIFSHKSERIPKYRDYTLNNSGNIDTMQYLMRRMWADIQAGGIR